ncbi:hypothetical protein F2Q68_00029212 [Brassica cretica]|uniref:Uncharacterized protein n=1 Tax=Brassica cretica TaxID=69181 RepID=A0A8S9GIC5_BRACR|nr:hypothetical protein F2Q68_00029212 [Brassica cretica]
MILKRYLGKFRRENSVDDSGQSGDRYRDGWQHGIQRRQNNFNYLIAEEDFDKESDTSKNLPHNHGSATTKPWLYKKSHEHATLQPRKKQSHGKSEIWPRTGHDTIFVARKATV